MAPWGKRNKGQEIRTNTSRQAEKWNSQRKTKNLCRLADVLKSQQISQEQKLKTPDRPNKMGSPGRQFRPATKITMQNMNESTMDQNGKGQELTSPGRP